MPGRKPRKILARHGGEGLLDPPVPHAGEANDVGGVAPAKHCGSVWRGSLHGLPLKVRLVLRQTSTSRIAPQLTSSLDPRRDSVGGGNPGGASPMNPELEGGCACGAMRYRL